MDPLEHVHYIRTVLIEDRFAQLRIICEDRVYIQTYQIFHRLFFIDGPDKDTLAHVMDPFHISE